MKANVAVCGRFHFANYIARIDRAGMLGRFYFSHKSATTAALGLSPGRAVNLPLKEYLVQGHGRLLGTAYGAAAFGIYGAIWARGVLARWQPADLLHVMAHGHESALIDRARRDGSPVLAEAVNTHPDHQRAILRREAEHWGVRSGSDSRTPREERLLDEVARADRILVPTETVRRSFTARGFDPATIVKLPYAANVARFSARTAEERRARPAGGPLRVICVGAIGLRKGQLHLLEACRRLGREIVELTLVGTVANEVAPLLERYKGGFRHLERVPNTELRSLLIAHDLFLLPSLEEGLAVANCEALACGLAVVTTRESGGEELIADGETGFLIEAGSTEAIVAKLQQLHADRDLIEAVGIRGGEAAKHQMNWDRYADSLMDVYRDLAGAAPARASAAR